MKYIFILSILLILSCNQNLNDQSNAKTNNAIVTSDYELIKAKESKALLILFPGGGATSKETKEEFNIIDNAVDQNISVLYMNFNLHFWLTTSDLKELKTSITAVLKNNDLEQNSIYIGGMSIGGNVALSFSNYLHQEHSIFKPKGTFIVDSPIDLLSLYESAQLDVSNKNFTEQRLAEPKWIISYLEEAFGTDDSFFTNIQQKSTFTNKTNSFENIKYLEDSKLRFYTEPDSTWWMENRQTNFINTNSFIIQKAYQVLKESNWEKVELIETKNKGYRANGDRHPHSWSIVDQKDLIDWIKEDSKK